MSAADGAIVGVLLAGGYSRRFGVDKLVQPLPDGTAIAVAAARTLLAACPRSISVLRPEQTVLHKLLIDVGVAVRVDAAPARGLGDSLACAVQQTPRAAGWLVALADMPFLDARTLRSVLEALENGAEIAAPRYRGRRGHPVGFSRRWFAELAGLQGDRGAGQFIEALQPSIVLIEVDDAGVHRDVDTPGDLLAS